MNASARYPSQSNMNPVNDSAESSVTSNTDTTSALGKSGTAAAN